ncbi:ABC transporter ATP-binding protein [Desulfosarcina ovata subsp. sediminis]|uniref:ABC transporter ATP-binding protein n=1 Tax=Desulfosarcina ovata subsp. sediminis TaxID=885957 RepID=A0A5K7ZZS5_9BACT|nr:ATP-binding cassette domain-containing protein [Desulfosarcina ovata]BBO85698.1 ABC transporter ATP-binding protein [Desulfosarcina ovata subsp. sediminis]
MNRPADPPAIVAEQVTRQFGDLAAVDGLSLTVAAGEIYGLVGPDGAGKTTTLRMLAGLLDPSGGRVRVAGCDLPAQSATVKTHLAYMSQRFGLYPDLTVDENIRFYADLYGMTRRARRARLDELLDFSNMRPFRKRLAGNLSGGMKQKLQLICALIHTPEVLLLDEPTNGVDPVSRRDFWRILYRMLKAGVAILVTTAYLDEAERCNRIGLMDQGRLLAEGRPDQVRQSFAGQILSVRSAQSRRASRILHDRLTDATSVDLYGDSVHIVCQDPQAATRNAGRILTRENIPVQEIRTIAPTLEDVFVNMVASSDDRVSDIVSSQTPAPTHDTAAIAVQVTDLTRRFGDFVAVDRLNLTVETGEIFGFLGPNGAGKSTTIRMLCGLLSPSAGGGRVAGCEIVGQAEAIKQQIGYMSQKFSLYEDLTVSENIDFYGGIYGLSGAHLADRKHWALSMAGLEGSEAQPARLLAGGWKQRLSLACAILHRPPIIFLDEPTSGVDPLSRRRFWDLIYDMAGRGRTVFVTTHYMEEAEYCDRVSLIYQGRMIALGSPRELKERLVEETILDLRCPAPQDLLDPLAAVEGVRDVALFGAGLHLKVDDEAATTHQIKHLLDRLGRSDVTVESIIPTMEDVFVSLIEKEDRRNGSTQHP